MDLAGDARPLGQRRRLRFRGVRAAGLFQGLFGLLGAEQVFAAGQAERPQPDERGRVADQGAERRADRDAGDEERRDRLARVSAADTSRSSLEPAAEVTTQPMATAVLKVDSPASVPPAAARTASATTTAG